MCVRVRVCACVCARTCARVCACVIINIFSGLVFQFFPSTRVRKLCVGGGLGGNACTGSGRHSRRHCVSTPQSRACRHIETRRPRAEPVEVCACACVCGRVGVWLGGSEGQRLMVYTAPADHIHTRVHACAQTVQRLQPHPIAPTPDQHSLAHPPLESAGRSPARRGRSDARVAGGSTPPCAHRRFHSLGFRCREPRHENVGNLCVNGEDGFQTRTHAKPSSFEKLQDRNTLSPRTHSGLGSTPYRIGRGL